MAEHHFQPEGTECIPNVLMMALHLTHLTKNIKLGCGFNITPMWHPLRLAEGLRDGGHSVAWPGDLRWSGAATIPARSERSAPRY